MGDGVGAQDRTVQIQVGDGFGIAAVLTVLIGGEGAGDIAVLGFFGDFQGEGLLRGVEEVLGLLRGLVEVRDLFGLALQIPVLAEVGVQLERAGVAVLIRVFAGIGDALALTVDGGSGEAEGLCREDRLRLNHVAGLGIEFQLKQLDTLNVFNVA